jgi:hypothetical protein
VSLGEVVPPSGGREVKPLQGTCAGLGCSNGGDGGEIALGGPKWAQIGQGRVFSESLCITEAHPPNAGVGMQEKKGSSRKKVLLVVGALVVVWYALMLSLPKLADGHGVLAFPQVVRSLMKQLAVSGKPYAEVKHEISKLQWKHGSVEYVPKLSPLDDQSWVLVARPIQSEVYHHSFCARVLFLDFYKHKCPSYRIKMGDEVVESIPEQEAF